MTTSAVIYLDQDRTASKTRHFARRAAELAELYGCVPLGARDGQSLLEAARMLPTSLERLVIVCHGAPTWLLRSGLGAHRWRSMHPRQVSVAELARVLAGCMADGSRIALGACLTGRSPHWYLSQLYGRLVSPWGPESYRRGGAHSIAAVLRDRLAAEGVPVVVGAHVVAGEALTAPLGREYSPVVDLGVSWYESVTGYQATTLEQRRRWVRVVKGGLAQRLLLDGPGVGLCGEIRRRL